MFRSSPRRNQRSKGFKVKHAVQVCLLLCVGIWLLYQVTHSRNKKGAYEESTRSWNEDIKLGRKDLNPEPEDPPIRDIRHKTEEEDERKKEEKESKPEVNDNLGKESIEDEIHDQDPEKNGEAIEHRENSIDGLKEGEESKENVTEDKLKKESIENVIEEKVSEDIKEFRTEKSKENVIEEKTGEENKENSTEDSQTEESDKKDDDGKESKVNLQMNGDHSRENNGEEGENKESQVIESEEAKENRPDEKGSSEQNQGSENKVAGEGNNVMENHEREMEVKEVKIEESSSSNNQMHDGNDSKIEDAREQHYKGDDASSEVAHETQISLNGNEHGDLGGSNGEETVGNNESNESKVESNESKVETNSDSQNEMVENNDSMNARRDDKNRTNMQEEEVAGHHNSTIAMEIEELQEDAGSTETLGSSLQNGTSTVQNENDRVDETASKGDDLTMEKALLEKTENNKRVTNDEQSSLDATHSVKEDEPNKVSTDSSTTVGLNALNGQTDHSNTSASEGTSYATSSTSKNSDAAQIENSNNNSEVEGTNKNVLMMNANDNAYAGQKLQADSAVSSTTQEAKNTNGIADASQNTGTFDASTSQEKFTSSNANNNADFDQKEQVDSSESSSFQEKYALPNINNNHDAVQSVNTADSSAFQDANGADASQKESENVVQSADRSQNESENTVQSSTIDNANANGNVDERKMESFDSSSSSASQEEKESSGTTDRNTGLTQHSHTSSESLQENMTEGNSSGEAAE